MYNIKIQTLFAFVIVLKVEGLQKVDSYSPAKERFKADLGGCTLFEKQCLQLDDDLALLSCALNTTHNNKTQTPFTCQHKIWSHQAELLDGTFLESELKDPCQDELIILECLGGNFNTIDCILKSKPSLKNKSCWRTVNKIESLIFNDWQITGNFLKSCLDDIEAHSCGRIPTDPKALSQTHTLKCLQSFEQSLRPECQSEIQALKEMKYSSLQMDRIVFAACNKDQTMFCPDEVPDSLLMYKCLVRHKHENGKFSQHDYFCLI